MSRNWRWKPRESRTEHDAYIRLLEAVILQALSEIDSRDVPDKDEMPAWEFMQKDGYEILSLLGFNIGGKSEAKIVRNGLHSYGPCSFRNGIS